MPKWVASIGTWDENGTPKYRAHHFEAADVAEAVRVVDEQLFDGEYLYEIRMRNQES